MIEPTLALQTAIRSALVSSPEVTALVDPDNILRGSTRPDDFDSIIMANAVVVPHGRASGDQFVAHVSVDLHIWAIEDSTDRAETIGGGVMRVLMDWPAASGFEFDEFKHKHTVWPRDPDSTFGHGVMGIEAIIRWKL